MFHPFFPSWPGSSLYCSRDDEECHLASPPKSIFLGCRGVKGGLLSDTTPLKYVFVDDCLPKYHGKSEPWNHHLRENMFGSPFPASNKHIQTPTATKYIWFLGACPPSQHAIVTNEGVGWNACNPGGHCDWVNHTQQNLLCIYVYTYNVIVISCIYSVWQIFGSPFAL